MLARLGPPLMEARRVEEAERLVEEAVLINRELGQRDELAMSLHTLSGPAEKRGDLRTAIELLEESAALAREIGHSWQLAWDLHDLAELALRREDTGVCLVARMRGPGAVQQDRGRSRALVCLGILTMAAAKRGYPRQAGALWGAAERLDHELGATLWSKEDLLFAEMLAEGGSDFEQGRAEAASLTLEEAVEYALAAID